jgi:peptidyl-prolyl cis-trans isomerase D
LEQVKSELAMEIRKDKKAERIMEDIKTITAIAQYQTISNAVSDTIKHVTFSAPAYISALRSNELLVSAYASVGELNQLSAPIKGNAGVLVLQIYAKTKQNDVFDAKIEKANQVNINRRLLNNFLNELHSKANIKDNRYLFF